MPFININEVEEQSFAAFDVTENTVLIPMLYARDVIKDSEGNEQYAETDVPASKLYTSAKNLIADLRGHFVTVNGEYDRSYVMAYELLLQGLNVVIKPIKYDNRLIGKEIEEDKAYELLENAIIEENVLDEFESRNIFNIKFITTGGYANCMKEYYVSNEDELEPKLATSYVKLRELAEARGDAIALIEYGDFFESEEKLFNTINNTAGDVNGDYFSAAFFPWVHMTSTATGSTSQVLMPACFAYLMAYANSVRDNANWFAAAGVNRGIIPNLIKPSFEVGEALMHVLQGDEGDLTLSSFVINPIYNAGTYGYKIWGNRVFSKNDTSYEDRYINFLNVRVLMCDIKKQIYHAAMRVTFEPNDDIVWINFKTLANTLLEKMKSGRGLRWYKWKKEVVSQKALIKATLTIQPIEAVESFEFTIVLTDEDATIEETI